MSKKTSIDNLASEIARGLEEYADLTCGAVKSAVRKTGRDTRKEIQDSAPKNTGTYAKSWRVSKTAESSNSLTLSVNSKNYQLTHLLEHGHAKRGGGRTRAYPHIAPSEVKAMAELTREIEKGIGRG